MNTVTLLNPAPYEIVIQLARHLKNITFQNGFLSNVTEASVFLDPRNVTNAGVANSKNMTVNVSYDLDDNQDQMPSHVNGLTEYHSTIFLNFFFWENNFDYSRTPNPQWRRAAIQADLHKYFFNFFSMPNRYNSPENNSLPDQNGNSTCRMLFIRRLNFNMNFQKKPNFQLDVELNVRWAAEQNNLYIKR